MHYEVRNIIYWQQTHYPAFIVVPVKPIIIVAANGQHFEHLM
jgi:hypothetical protein